MLLGKALIVRLTRRCVAVDHRNFAIVGSEAPAWKSIVECPQQAMAFVNVVGGLGSIRIWLAL